ncbi:putative beta-lysine N-acetyltransferase [Candidatus Desulforudis audaxviator]|uniref:GCN5-related N-acetyltransferase n=1 Tax=Desulforudis audaxviator (strain MP104C) TaxID=477974 RepID=B1I0T8_DESAP|nr:putative beta-lysine N-acetyltransferase [Candidatus Desulforudis audaxviator]ACA58734.1 GCN5-related N-acetyltransferase [Candidatus Desulforudis audaxviator MP104C]AZK58742.1 Beta-lysine acetyltransferase [Candidatus Desulforudis audaxviator]
MLFTETDDLVRVNNEGYSYHAHNDDTNERLWVFDYRVDDHSALADALVQHARKKGYGKIVFPVREEDTAALTPAGFVTEARAEGFFDGRTALFLAYYLNPARQESGTLAGELEILAEIRTRPREIGAGPDPDIALRPADTGDIPELARLFGTVFQAYPTPVDDPEYLELAMGLGTLFQVATTGGRIVGAAAAEIDPSYKNAEMTNCATHPDFRGRGLASHLLFALERTCAERGYRCFWSLSRAGSYGMNLVFHRLGYRHGGTLINNARFGGRFEDLHLWVKYPA